MPRLKPYSWSACCLLGGDAAEHAADLRAAAEEVRGLPADDVEVLVLGDVGVAVLGQLVQLAFDHPERDVAQQPHDVERVVRERQRHRLDVEVVAEEDRDVVAPPRVHRQPAAAQLRVVDDVVVDERGRVDELDDRGVEARRGRPDSRSAAPPSAARPGRMRLPPLVWMYCPIFGMSSTCDSTWRPNSRSTRSRSPRIGSKICESSGVFSTAAQVGTLSRPEQAVKVGRGLLGQRRSCRAVKRRERVDDLSPRTPARSACRDAAPAPETGCRSRPAGDRAAPASPSRAAPRPSGT